jgi:beta-galactosidase
MVELTRRFLIGSAALVPAMGAGRATAAESPKLPVFTGGAVYFRKSNPPPEQWARDYKSAADIGINTFRHWFMWAAIEVEPGKYDWADYDRQMELAAQNGLKTIVAINDANAPEWIYRKLPDARYMDSEGGQDDSNQSGSSATGGFPGLCLDNPEAREALGRFITELVKRYRNHPALLGYDLWNEQAGHGGVPPRMYCFCHGSQARLRDWLKKRYGSLAALNKAHRRYSYASWDDVSPPRTFDGYAESLDFLQFRIENAYDLFDWRIALIKALDPVHLIACHGTAYTLNAHGTSTVDEWRAASRVDVYGMTWIAARQGAEPWKQYCAIDLVRAGARGKPIWHAEATGGPLWMQRQLPGRPREDGRVTKPEDVRLTHMVSCAGGATGIFYTRLRALLDGPLFGAFGLFAMDGSKTPQAEMASKLIHWGNAHPEVWRARPVRGEVGLLFAEESEFFNVIQQKSSDFYYEAMRGAYQAFWASNIQPDFVAPENIDEYKLLYVAYPVMLRSENAARLQRFVKNGGTLICEGFPAYFGDGGHVGEVQPNYGFDQLFGCRQAEVEFNPDLSENMELEVHGHKLHGRYYRQDYTPTTGKAVGHYPDGGIAAVENRSGPGRTLLIGSFPGAGYYKHHAPGAKELFAGFLDFAGVKQRVAVSNPSVQARLHEGLGRYLWATNASSQQQTVTVTLDRSAASAKDVWAGLAISVQGNSLSFTLPAKDAAVILLA